MTTPRYDVTDLLRIDVAAELRKLAEGQLQGMEQLPTELVRRALRGGANNVHVQLSRHRLRIVDDGPGPTHAVLDQVAHLLDRMGEDADRHLALVRLERQGELALLAVAALDVAHLEVSCARGSTLVYDRGRPPRLLPSTASGWTTVVLRSRRLDRAASESWLRGACRFARASITLGSKELSTGLSGLAQGPLTPPLAGEVAIPLAGETAHAHVLQHGIVSAHATVPQMPCFEAAVEMGEIAGGPGAAALRAALQPHVDELVDQAVSLMIRVGKRASELPRRQRARVAGLLLRAAKKQRKQEEIFGLELFRAATSHGRVTWLDLRTMRSSASTDGRAVLAIYPGQSPEAFVLGTDPVWILDDVERSLLSDLLGVRFSPPPRATASSLVTRVQRATRTILSVLRRLAVRAIHPFHRTRCEDEALTPEERSFLNALRDHLPYGRGERPASIRMCEGRGPLYRTGGGAFELLLPRANPDVVACVAACARDPGWLYPSYLLLLEGRALAPPNLRARFLRALSGRP